MNQRGLAMPRSVVAACAALALALSVIADARAQDASYPSKPVRLLIGFPPGGLLDTVSRIVGERMSSLLGQPFVVDARPGAGGLIATSALAKSPPDGYTLMMVNDNHALNPFILKEIPYDSVKDFAPIGFVGSTPLVFNAHPGLGLKSIKDLVEMAKAKSGALTYGSVGPGSLPHLSTALFTQAAKVTMNHVPYKGGAPAMNDLIGGHIHTMMTSLVISKAHIDAGRLTPLAVAWKHRLEPLPHVPTMAEAGYPLDAAYWFGLMAPAGTPPAVIARLEKALANTVVTPEVRNRLAELGTLVTPMNAKEFGAFIQSEMAKWRDAVKNANVKIE
jgi:tripartite-type tricarboxylate transporter receptor subunit TctC